MSKKPSLNAVRITTSLISTAGGLLSLEHGIYLLLQGRTPVRGVMINAIGSPCDPSAIWHACLPALTLLPTYFLAGILTVLLSLAAILTGWFALQKRRGAGILSLLAFLLLACGGGYIPVFLLLIAAGAKAAVRTSSRFRKTAFLHNNRTRFQRLWQVAVALFISWYLFFFFLGDQFNELILQIGSGLFLLDLLLPLAAAIFAVVLDQLNPLYQEDHL